MEACPSAAASPAGRVAALHLSDERDPQLRIPWRRIGRLPLGRQSGLIRQYRGGGDLWRLVRACP